MPLAVLATPRFAVARLTAGADVALRYLYKHFIALHFHINFGRDCWTTFGPHFVLFACLPAAGVFVLYPPLAVPAPSQVVQEAAHWEGAERDTIIQNGGSLAAENSVVGLSYSKRSCQLFPNFSRPRYKQSDICIYLAR